MFNQDSYQKVKQMYFLLLRGLCFTADCLVCRFGLFSVSLKLSGTITDLVIALPKLCLAFLKKS